MNSSLRIPYHSSSRSAAEQTGRAKGDRVFTRPDCGSFRQLIEGVRLRTLAHGERTLLGEFHFDRGAVVPVHEHTQEQTGYLVAGRLLFEVAGQQIEAVRGTGWNIAAGVRHGAQALEESVVVEVFAPVREDYLP